MSNNKIGGSSSPNPKRVTENKDKHSNKEEKIASGLFSTKSGGVKFSFKPLKAFKAWIKSFGKNKVNTRVEKRFESLKEHLNIDVKDLTKDNSNLKKIYNKIRFGIKLSSEDIGQIGKEHNRQKITVQSALRDAIIDKLKTNDSLAFRINNKTKATDDVEVLLMNEVMQFLQKNESYLKDCTTDGKLDNKKFENNISEIFKSIGNIVKKEKDRALGQKQFDSLTVNEINVTTQNEQKTQQLSTENVESTTIQDEKIPEPELSPLEKAKSNLINLLMEETNGLFSNEEIIIAIEEVSKDKNEGKLPSKDDVLKNLEDLAINKYQNAKGDEIAKKIEIANKEKKKKMISKALSQSQEKMDGKKFTEEMERLNKEIPDKQLTLDEELKIQKNELNRLAREVRGPLFFRFEVVKQAIEEKNNTNN